MRNCKDCKWSNEDYVRDEELEDEYQIYTCDKGNDTELDSDCGDFKKYKPENMLNILQNATNAKILKNASRI